MSFLAPGAFFLGLLLPVIIALYLLKLRRVEREVPSNYLWRRMVRDVEANAPWQKLRPNLLMILQLLFLAALVLALTRPFTWTEGASGEAAILILDSSASMAAVDVAPSRIESAKTRARQLVDDQPDTARVTIIEAGREARVLLSASLDRRQAHLAITGVRAGSGGSDLAVALELASAIAARQPGTEIIVLSDGRVELPERMAIRGSLRYIPFGLSGENQAISLLTLEASSAGDAAGGSLTAFAQVSNYGEEAAARRLSLYADGLLVNAFDLPEIPPGGQHSVVAEGIPPDTLQIEARLSGADVLPVDDAALAVRPATQPVPVRLVTQGNRFIRTALGLLPGVTLTEQTVEVPAPSEDDAAQPGPTATPTTPPAEDSQPEEPGPAPALVIYDGILPGQIPASGSLLFIAPPRSTDLFTVSGLVETPAVRVVDPSDPLLNYLSLAEVSVLDAVRIPLPDWATPVVAGELENENVSLLFRGEVGGRRVVVLAFDLRRSDLPLQVAVPLLFANLVEWLVPGAGSSVPTQVAPGESVSFTAPQGVETAAGSISAAVTLPDGSTVTTRAENGRFLFSDTDQTGVYTIRFAAQPGQDAPDEFAVPTASFAVNLFSPQESFVSPAASLPGLETAAGSTPAAGSTSAAGTSGENQPGLARREWWRPLALLALGLLAGEWLVYQRAALVRLRDLLRAALHRRGAAGAPRQGPL